MSPRLVEALGENAVPWQDLGSRLLFRLDSQFAKDLDNHMISAGIREAFEKNGISLPDDAIVWGSDNHWGIRRDQQRGILWTITKTAEGLNVRDNTGGFTRIGFITSSAVRFVYQSTVTETGGFVTEALGDTDADGKRILFVSSESMGPHLVGGPYSIDGRLRDVSLPLSLGTREDTED